MLSNDVNDSTQIHYFKSLKASFLLIFLAMIIYRNLDQYITQQIEAIIRSPDGINSIVWAWGGLSLVTSLFFPTIVSVICLYALRFGSLRGFLNFFNRHFELSVLETLRAWSYSFLWGLLFIIPGLIKMSFYYLTLFVVLFRDDYHNGKVDALEMSAEISKTHWWKLNLFVALFYLLIPSVASVFLDEYTVFEKFPLSALAYTAFESVMLLLFHYFILNLFKTYFLRPQGDLHVAYV